MLLSVSMRGEIPCWQCTAPIDADVVYRRIRRNDPEPDLCKDCKDVRKPVPKELHYVHPVLGETFCTPYKGELNDDWQPIDSKGNLYLPGVRICGYKDCVRKSHIIPAEVKTPAESEVSNPTGATDERGQ